MRKFTLFRVSINEGQREFLVLADGAESATSQVLDIINEGIGIEEDKIQYISIDRDRLQLAASDVSDAEELFDLAEVLKEDDDDDDED